MVISSSWRFNPGTAVCFTSGRNDEVTPGYLLLWHCQHAVALGQGDGEADLPGQSPEHSLSSGGGTS